MTITVFAGPSLPNDLPWPSAVERLPPAGLGDIYRLAAGRHPPAVIGLVDGYFERRPPVRHKEILWALSRGIRVVGAASIGALRAAELHPYGMEGVGAIFEGYRSGFLCGEPLEADDEVAVLHGPFELGYPSVTVALVDLRVSLSEAVDAGQLSSDERSALLDAARRLHFKERTLERILDVSAASLPPAALQTTGDWLAEKCVSQKQCDAAALLNRVLEIAEDPAARGDLPPVPIFRVDDFWLDFVSWAERSLGDDSGGSAELLTALAVDPPLWERTMRHALLRVLTKREAARRGRNAEDDIADLLDLYSPTLAKVIGAALNDLGEREAVEEIVLRRRAIRKRIEDGSLELSVTTSELIEWHFGRLSTPAPFDLESYARRLGLSRAELLLRALAEDFAAASVERSGGAKKV